MSGAVRAAADVGMVVDAGRETDFSVLAEVPSARAPHVRRPSARTKSAFALARLFLSGSSGSVDAGVC
jgi:hypothetical protein